MVARVLGAWISLVIFLPAISSAQEWVARYDGAAHWWDMPRAIALDSAANVYVTGGEAVGIATSGHFYCRDIATVKYDSSGVEQWVRRYDGPVNGWDEAFAIALDDRANVYVTGKSFGSGTDMDYATVSYDSSGVERWVARYNGPGDDYDRAGAIAVDNAGNAYVTGNSSGSGTGYDYATLKYGPLGTEQWVARYNGPGNDGDWALAIAVDNAGSVCVTGGSCGLGTRTDYATIKYDSSSTEQWVVRYDGPASVSDMAHAIALDNAGNVYVTGPSDGTSATYTDYATVKYNSSGMQQWVARYDGLGNWDDYATAIAVDNTGNAYVTGRSEGVLTNQDYATIKYASLGTQECVLRPTPGALRSLRVYPNPFSKKTGIKFEVTDRSKLDFRIYDATGNVVREFNHAANQQVLWNGTDESNKILPSGVYFLKFRAGDCSATRKLLLVR